MNDHLNNCDKDCKNDIVTDAEFQRRYIGHGMCDRCGALLVALAIGFDKTIDSKLMEIYPDGKWGSYCRSCLEIIEGLIGPTVVTK
jgi:hypothetical protein